MLHSKKLKPSGFRLLSLGEIEQVSGGYQSWFFVDQQRLGDINAFLQAHGDGAGGIGGGNPFVSAGQIIPLTAEQLEALTKYLEENSDGNDESEEEFVWTPSQDQVEFVDDNGDGEFDEIVLTYNKEDVDRWSDFAAEATYWTQLYLKLSATTVGAGLGLNAFLAEKIGIHVGVAAAIPFISMEALNQMTKEEMMDFFFDAARDVTNSPETSPLENQGNNPGPRLPWP